MGGQKRRTHEEFTDIVKEHYGDEFLILSKYQTKRKKVIVRHVKCGKSFETVADNFVRKGRACCPHCKVAWNKRTPEQFREDLKVVHGNDYILLSEYVSAKTKVRLKHVECGYEWDQHAKNTLLGHGCPKCGHKKAMETQSLCSDEFSKRIHEKTKGEYAVLTQYTRMHHEVIVMHVECGRTYTRLASDVLAACTCPYCPTHTNSKGELLIAEYLNVKGYSYESQYRFEDCVYKHVLPFDFAVLDQGVVVMLIEFQGRQHYEPVEHFGGMEEYYKVLHRDAVKKSYCEEKGIPLLIIPHWTDDVNGLLDKELHKQKEYQVSAP